MQAAAVQAVIVAMFLEKIQGATVAQRRLLMHY
jgi:hypothetical protein